MEKNLTIFIVELTIEEDQKRLYASKKEEPTRVQYSGISGFVNFSGWKVCRDVRRFLSTVWP
jgi:hypothetical protein